jgi:hypothetical protein
MKVLSWFLGVMFFVFGTVKFIDPFKTWYTVQLSKSGLPMLFYWPGQLGEIFVGVLFLYAMISFKKLKHANLKWLLVTGNIIVLIAMSVAIFVHLQPNVPAEVLPMKIKDPFIPGVCALIAILNTILVLRQKEQAVNPK